ncbi:transglycosylase SLT domain-containing protein [Shewanella maritima]|uniref:transglycosylase SLT domain-containing protein n=1 Tax=Shewanella maritima TaxID=2520507 RepID=UPI0037355AA7
MRKKLLALLCVPICLAYADQTFDQFKQQQKTQQQDYLQQQQAQFADFREAYLNEFDAYRSELLAHWSTPIQSSLETQVEYSDSLNARIIIDEQSQTLTIEQLIGHQPLAEEKQDSIQLLKEITDNPEVIEQYQQGKFEKSAQPVVVSSHQVLKQHIHMQYEQVLSSIDADKNLSNDNVAAQKQYEQQQYQQRLTELDKQLNIAEKRATPYKKVQSLTMALPDDYLFKKVSPFINEFQKHANVQQQDLPLLLAISHAESSFDPQAKSHIPAFGLMQIVPRSAGMDVANKLLKQSSAPTATELYQPNTNILYGAGYLSILSNQYLKGIHNQESKKFCVIAAYNTGSGNVARAFNGGDNKSVKQALAKINAMSSEEVYQTLLSKLPYSETQKYLKKVRKLEAQYQSQIPKWNGDITI